MLNAKLLAQMAVGDCIYVEAIDGDYQKQMNVLGSMLTKSRRAKILEGRTFRQQAYTAVSSNIGDVTILVKIHRTS